MIKRVMIFTPYGPRLEPETVRAVQNIRWRGPLVWLLQCDNPYADKRENITHQYQQGRRAFLAGQYDAMLVVESDIIPPPATLERLAALLDEHGADIAHGVYVFRNSRHVNVLRLYENGRNVGESLSMHPAAYRKALEKGITGCSGGGLGCVLIARHVLEQIDFRHPANDGGYCDSWWARDVMAAGLTQLADMRLLCGHKNEYGQIEWPGY